MQTIDWNQWNNSLITRAVFLLIGMLATVALSYHLPPPVGAVLSIGLILAFFVSAAPLRKKIFGRRDELLRLAKISALNPLETDELRMLHSKNSDLLKGAVFLGLMAASIALMVYTLW